jgi:TIR domain
MRHSEAGGGGVADIFVSYTKSDRQWAHWIAQELTALHHEPHVHDWEIGLGEDIVGWMEKQHDEADYVLCVVSPDYLDEDKAPFSTWERRAALWRMVKGRKGHVLLFVVKRSDCQASSITSAAVTSSASMSRRRDGALQSF